MVAPVHQGCDGLPVGAGDEAHGEEIRIFDDGRAVDALEQSEKGMIVAAQHQAGRLESANCLGGGCGDAAVYPIEIMRVGTGDQGFGAVEAESVRAGVRVG